MQTIGDKHAGVLIVSSKDESAMLFISLKKSLTLQELNCSSTVSNLVLLFLAHWLTFAKAISLYVNTYTRLTDYKAPWNKKRWEYSSK